MHNMRVASSSTSQPVVSCRVTLPLRPTRVLAARNSETAQSHASEEFKFRRRILGATAILVSTAFFPQVSQAAFFQFETPWTAFSALQPSAIGTPRRQLNLNFAVMLMRATYDSIDALDFVAMDKFQVKFWKLRQSEFEPYKFMYDPIPVPVGELTSPVYFDFISFCQFATVSQLIPDAPQVFQEMCEEGDGDPLALPLRTVRRDVKFSDNAKLPNQLQVLTGDYLHNSLQNGFRGQTFSAPAPCTSTVSIPELAVQAQKVLDVFVANGYAIKARLSDVVETKGGGGTWTVKVDAPANLWGLATLQFRRALLGNAFEAFALQGYLRASGFSSSFKTEVVDAVAIHSWTVKRL